MQSLKEFLGVPDLIDVKVSINGIATPEEILRQMARVIKLDQQGLLTEFIDY